MGDNRNGQCGFDEEKQSENVITEPKLLMNDKTIKIIACGGRHSMICKENGELIVVGSNSEGQLGIKTKLKNTERLTILMIDKGIKDIALGYAHSLILNDNGDLFCFGKNSFGTFFFHF